MRKLMLTVLLAISVAMPAMAQDDGGRHRDRDQNAVSQGDEARAARRAERSERMQGERPQVSARANWSDRGEARQQAVQQQAVQEPTVQRPQEFRQQRGQRRSWGDRGSDNIGVIQRQQLDASAFEREQPVVEQHDYRRDGRNRDDSLLRHAIEPSRVTTGQAPVTRDEHRRYDRRGPTRYWSNEWRSDRNYDWRHYRDRNRSVFRLGNYYDPYGSRYRRFSIGFSLFPSYFQSNYWLSDPSMYRLPPAYGPYRWVRYYDDALLVNVYTGQVVDVVYSFFW